MSGRSVSFLQPLLPDGLYLSGLYGMEEVETDGKPVVAQRFSVHRPAVEAAAAAAAAAVEGDPGLSGVGIENKGLSLTLHFRVRPQARAAVESLADELAVRFGLERRGARASVELHPPVDTSKGSVVSDLLARFPDVGAVMFVGDDVGDVPAFKALAELAGSGVRTCSVAVTSSETDRDVLEAADLVISEDEVVVLLDVLLADPSSAMVAEGE